MEIERVDAGGAVGEAAICYSEADAWPLSDRGAGVICGMNMRMDMDMDMGLGHTSICACDSDDLPLELYFLHWCCFRS
jgi:hypothetical protein